MLRCHIYTPNSYNKIPNVAASATFVWERSMNWADGSQSAYNSGKYEDRKKKKKNAIIPFILQKAISGKLRAGNIASQAMSKVYMAIVDIDTGSSRSCNGVGIL